MTLPSGLFTNRRSTIQPKLERTKNGELIYVFADGSWKYFWEWIATSNKQQFNQYEKPKQLTNK
jgi:hypothetical protein